MVERRKDEGERGVCCFPAPQKPACELRRTASLCWHVSQVLNEGMTQWLSLISGEIIASGHRQFGRTVLTCCQRSADKRNEKRKGGVNLGSGRQGGVIYIEDFQRAQLQADIIYSSCLWSEYAHNCSSGKININMPHNGKQPCRKKYVLYAY